MQKNRRAQRKIGAECLTIGFAVYQVNNSINQCSYYIINTYKYITFKLSSVENIIQIIKYVKYLMFSLSIQIHCQNH